MIKVKEPQRPVEGEYTLCNKGEVAVYRNGKWIRPNENK
jgi:hypothetical protein|tara:strand:- start:3743 stop:3859 length:117 start_codon:yes stop_codon:yes gene_type:complete